MQDFLNVVQASEAEVKAGLQRLKALELKGKKSLHLHCYKQLVFTVYIFSI